MISTQIPPLCANEMPICCNCYTNTNGFEGGLIKMNVCTHVWELFVSFGSFYSNVPCLYHVVLLVLWLDSPNRLYKCLLLLHVYVHPRAKSSHTLLHTIATRQIRFLGHILRKNALETVALTGAVEGRRARGWQRLTFLSWLRDATGTRLLHILRRCEQKEVSSWYATSDYDKPPQLIVSTVFEIN